MHGWWEDGLPVGPFRASEYGSDYVMTSIRIGIVHNRAEVNLKHKFTQPRFSSIGIVWGVVSVECSVAGHFFRHLPACELLGGADGTKDAGWCLNKLKHLDHEFDESDTLPPSVVIRADKGTIFICDHEQEPGSSTRTATIEIVDSRCDVADCAAVAPPPSSTRDPPNMDPPNMDPSNIVCSVGADPSSTAGERPPYAANDLVGSFSGQRWAAEADRPPGLRVHGWRPVRKDSATEALVFVPGFNASAEAALLALGQLLGSGDFPGRIRPFVFSWPTGGTFGYFQAVSIGATSERTCKDFAECVASLRDEGVTQLHVVTHSMGARTLFSALPYLREVVQRVDSDESRGVQSSSQSSGIRMATCVLISPDADQKSFLDHDFDALRQLCRRITMYGDERDWALFFSEVFTRERSLGKHPHELVRGGSTREVTPPLCMAGSVNSTAGSTSQPNLRTADHNLRTSSGRFVSSSAASYSSGTAPALPLDMDVIDTSWMDSNVQALRHSYFNVNRWLIDDIRDTIVMRSRAHERTSRLTHRRGNVWSFLAAPRHVVAD